MTHHKWTYTRVRNTALALALTAALAMPLFPGRAEAGKEGVFLNDSVYFTLEEARLSPGSDTQTFRFTLELVNGAGVALDYNKYGVAVTDGAGNWYAAELAEKISARVLPNTARQFKYVARIPAGVPMDELRTEIFAWNFSAPDFMDEKGALSVAAAAEISQTDKPQAVFDLKDADASYPNDALVSFELQKSYKVLVNGTWTVYVHLLAENLSSSSLKLSSSLQYSLKDGRNLTYAGTSVYGADQQVLPHQKGTVILQFPVGDMPEGEALTLEFGKKSSTSASSGTSSGSANSAASNSGNTASNTSASASTSSIAVLGTLDVSASLSPVQVGVTAAYTVKSEVLDASVDSVNVDSGSGSLRTESVFTLTNNGKSAVSVPVLSAYYQVEASTFSVSANESGAHPTYLAPGDSTTYYFNADLPSGVEGGSAQLVVQERKSDNPVLSVPVFVAQVPESSQSAGPVDTAEGNTYVTSAGKLRMTMKSSYRLLSDGGSDIMMSELQVENLESTAVKLPILYAGYTDGVNAIEGKASLVQTSSFLNPGQKTTVYLYAEIPFDVEMPGGSVYFGQGVLDAKTNAWSQKKEWGRVPFEVKASSIASAEVDQSWYINDSSRLSAARVVESKLYSNPETSASSLLAAIRIEQKNQMTRNGAAVPYTGYIRTSDGAVYPLQATQEAGKLNKDAKALTTLWAKLPSGVLDDKAEVVFGQQIEGQAFASPMKMDFEATPNKPSETDDLEWTINESLYPYTVKLGSIKRIYDSQNKSTVPGVNAGGSGKYTFEFDFKLERTTELAGSGKNRFLHFELEDSTGGVVKSWDVPLVGNGAMEDGRQTLTLSTSEIQYVDDFLNGNRLKVYEKFENGLRMLGSLNYMLGE